MEFILENENLRVTVESHGAELVSVVNKQTGAEMLWQADPAVWARHAPVLFPYCGRLKDGAFTCKGVRYEGGQHGFARDMEPVSYTHLGAGLCPQRPGCAGGPGAFQRCGRH